MIFSVDVMGYENDISESIKACRDFCKKNNDVKIILVGDETKIKMHLKSNDNFTIHHASEEILMTDDPLTIRNKKNSSMYQAIELVKLNKADGVLSAGNTSCFVFLSYIILGKIKGISKIGFMPFMPTRKGNGVNFIDVGANKECDALDLVSFAKMGKIYIEKVRQIKNPKIGILNIGTEENKGLNYHIEANKLLKNEKNINYIGFIESRELLEGNNVDLIVSDGFVGNITLKALEGTFKTVAKSLLDTRKKPLFGWLWFLLSLPNLLKIKKKFDYKNNAGAIVIGLNKIAVKTHGSADYKQFYSSLRLLKETVNANLIKILEEEFK
ncbi:MAG: phosphate acyltransferase PlsX [Malacoplasma sp.]|nr:phosphate acyltransferase PlsX [Malacoplasma sp.]